MPYEHGGSAAVVASVGTIVGTPTVKGFAAGSEVGEIDFTVDAETAGETAAFTVATPHVSGTLKAMQVIATSNDLTVVTVAVKDDAGFTIHSDSISGSVEVRDGPTVAAAVNGPLTASMVSGLIGSRFRVRLYIGNQ